MKKLTLNWTLSHTPELAKAPVEFIPATVPGAVQLDYAKALNYKPYYFGINFKQFDWMEDEYFIYDSVLDFTISNMESATLCFMGIDYKYQILIDGKSAAKGEGMFTPVYIDVSAYSGKKVPLKVVLDPIPKCPDVPKTRAQARACCKPASSYGWDWHPRLVPSGIWDEAYIRISPIGSPFNLQASYRLSEDLKSVTVTANVDVCGQGVFEASITDGNGKIVASEKRTVGENQTETFVLTVQAPELWFPRGYGSQPLYTLTVKGNDSVSRRIGFRRSKLIHAKGAEIFESTFPKGPKAAPMTIEINGKRVFAKGSNWVNTEIFPCLMTNERYDELIQLAYDANMNIFRMWGGQFINHEYFYDRCDELGIMLWQEFMLSCNLHPDTDDYLAVLEQEATTIIKRLRTHPSITFWCGGNELFNSWSGLTCQSHPLRLLDSLCYKHDRFTPFNMTSPLHGVHHGSYVKVQFPDDERRDGNYENGEEFICAVKRSVSTAYTEFGCNAASPAYYIKKYIMDEKDYADCSPNNEVWVAHHAFKAWNESSWIGLPEIIHFFGGYTDTDDIVDKSIYLQNMCYKSMFEEMRRQAPLCSMAINWDFNEPWPCAAGNSLVNWPAEPKPCLKSVGEALRPTIFSLNVSHNRYLTGETFTGEIWMLNDSDDEIDETECNVYCICGDKKMLIKLAKAPAAKARSNSRGVSFEFKIPKDFPERFSISIESEKNPQYNSTYDFVHNKILDLSVLNRKIVQKKNDDFSDFLK